jgi:hypothetical protein
MTVKENEQRWNGKRLELSSNFLFPRDFVINGQEEGQLMVTKTKKDVRISRRDWDKMKKNPIFSEALELLEDIADLEAAKEVRGKDMTLSQYLRKRGLRISVPGTNSR